MDVSEAHLASVPPEQEVRLGPWRLRRSAGGGRRETAAVLSWPPEQGAVTAAIEAMRRWGQRPLFLVRDEETVLDAALAAASLAVEAPTVLLGRDAAAMALQPEDLTVIDCDGPIAMLAELWGEADGGSARLAAMARVRGPRRYLLGRMDDRAAAAAFVSVHGGAAILNALYVAPRARRRGLGRRMLQWAAGWGAAQGASTLGLAVEADNAPALALCRSVGMRRVGGYHYRAAAAS